MIEVAETFYYTNDYGDCGKTAGKVIEIMEKAQTFQLIMYEHITKAVKAVNFVLDCILKSCLPFREIR